MEEGNGKLANASPVALRAGPEDDHLRGLIVTWRTGGFVIMPRGEIRLGANCIKG